MCRVPVAISCQAVGNPIMSAFDIRFKNDDVRNQVPVADTIMMMVKTLPYGTVYRSWAHDRNDDESI